MPRHVVREGECAASIGARHGLSAHALMNRDGNSALRDARPNHHVLAPGDVVDVPDAVERRIAFTHGGTARYKARVPKAHVRLRLLLPSGDPAANKRFEVAVPGARAPITGTSDGDGVVDVEVAVLHTHATLRLQLGERDWLEIPVHIGHMDPDALESGVRARLANLGHAPGQGADALADAVRRFQIGEELPVTGVVDDETRARLLERSGT